MHIVGTPEGFLGMKQTCNKIYPIGNIVEGFAKERASNHFYHRVNCELAEIFPTTSSNS